MKIFHLPDLGEGLAEAEIREWYVKTGDTVTVDQPLLAMETAKALVDVPSPYAGRIAQLYGKNGDKIATHAPLVAFDCEETLKKDKGTVVGNLEESEIILEEGDTIIGLAPPKTQDLIKAMPAVRALAKQLQVDLHQVKASGTKGQITAEDVKNYKKQLSQTSSQAEPLRGARHFMALTMMQSHQSVVPATINDDADITHLTQHSDLTVHIIQALIQAVKAEPALNAWFDGKTMCRTLLDDIQLGLAVDTEEGLFVPVLREVNNKNSHELRDEINTLKKATRARSLTPENFSGATLTLSNFGVFAGRYANLIVVPPMVAILGTGRAREVALPFEGKLAIRKILPLSLSFDHRAVTGGEATRFLAALIKQLEQ